MCSYFPCDFFNYGRNTVCLRCDCKRPGEVSLGTSNTRLGMTYENGNNANKWKLLIEEDLVVSTCHTHWNTALWLLSSVEWVLCNQKSTLWLSFRCVSLKGQGFPLFLPFFLDFWKGSKLYGIAKVSKLSVQQPIYAVTLVFFIYYHIIISRVWLYMWFHLIHIDF